MKKVFNITIAVVALFFISASYANGDHETVTNTLDAIGKPTLAFAVAKNELAERELIKHFRHTGTWLARVPSKNKWVNNDVIKMNEIGGDPIVLINNNTYPIAVAARPDDSIAISLFKYDTENTVVTDDELYALPYDKVGSVQEQHRLTLEEKTREHALHSLAPTTNTADTPIIKTTGALVNNRRQLIYADLVAYKTKLDKLKIPKTGRLLVLCADHVADLLLEDKALNIQYQNHKEGAIAKNYCGFELYEDVYNPVYVEATSTKIAFDSVTAGVSGSTFFLVQRTAKARGSVKRYQRDSKLDPENRETVLGFRLYFLAIPITAKGQGAIIDATA